MSSSRGKNKFRWAGLLLLTLCGLAQTQDALLDKVVDVDVPAQTLTRALIELSRQSGIQILAASDLVDGLDAPAVLGRLPLRDALAQLLQNTVLNFQPAGASTIGIVLRGADGGATGERPALDDAQNAPALPDTGDTAVSAELESIPVASGDAPPSASRSDATELDTIVVTAGKRVQDIRAVPGSVAALGGEALENRNAQGMEDYLKLVPGVTFSKSSIDGGVPVIRGIASGLGIDQTPVPVGVYVDEVPFGDLFLPTSVSDLYPFDLERIEVLKGPQGTLFGSGSLSGAVRYITNKPELSIWQSKAMLGYSSFNEGGAAAFGAGMLNVPLGGSAGLRLVGVHRETPGVIDETNRGVENADRITQSAGRALARWLPTDRLSLDLLYYRQESEQDNESFANQQERLERDTTPEATPRKSDFDVINLTGGYNFDWGTLLSSSSRKTKTIRNQSNLARNTGAPETPLTPGTTEGPGAEDQDDASLVLPLDADIEGFVQEFRLSSPDNGGPWHWLLGAAFQRDNEFLLNTQPTPGVSDAIEPTPISGSGPDRNLMLQYIQLDATATEKAFFADITRRLGERWEVSAGARLFQTELVADTFFTGVVLTAVANEVEARERISVEESGINPKFSLSYRLTDNASLYALAAKGFQFGGVQILPASLATTTVAGQGSESGFTPYKSSDLWNYEFGTRTDWWDHRLQFDLTLFYIDWKDLQLTQTDANRVFSFVGNVAAAHSRGVEVALALTPLRGVRWQSSAAWVEAETDEFFEAPSGNVEPGTFLPGAARFSMANVLSLQWPTPLFGFDLGGDLTHSHTGKRFNSLQHDRTLEAYSTADARLYIARPGSRLQPELSFNVNNLTDVRAVSNINDRSRTDDVWFIRPRATTLSLTLRFF